MTNKLLMGNEAIAHAALEAGVGVVAGYPGTPSSEIVETISRQYIRGAAHGVHVEWSTNEKVALEMLFGASLAGKRGLFACKQMGLNVASDALMSLNYVSVRGGLVLVVADDPGPISSQTEQDTRRFAMFAKVPVLDPATPEQAFIMVRAAFELSEHFHTPVIVRPTTRVDHASAFLDVQEETFALPPIEGGFEHNPERWVIFPKRAYEAHGEINERLKQISNIFSNEPTFASFNSMVEAGQSFTGEPTFGIMAGGVTASYAREALRIVNERARKAGIGVPAYRFMQVGTPYPFPERAVTGFVTGLANVLVLEELDSVLEDQLAMFAGRTHAAFNLHGKSTGEARDRGENDVDDIVMRIERFLGLTGRLSLHRLRGGETEPAPVRLNARAESELPDRPPVLCAGCPHRGAFYAVKEALDKEPAVLCGDIGCYTLGNAHPLDAVDTCLCMGGGITMAQGISVADPEKKAIAYVGDSTFFASGMPGLANASYNGHDITVIVLDNATTAMTGNQPHPGTGYTLMDEYHAPLDIETVLVANGFRKVFHANPFDRDASVIALRAAFQFEGPSAVIFEGPCVQMAEPHPPVSINRDICTGCKRCITGIGCPAISFNANIEGTRSRGRGQAVIDVTQCTGCGLCTQVCPFHAIHGDPAVYRNARASRSFEYPHAETRLVGSAPVIVESGVYPDISGKQSAPQADEQSDEPAVADVDLEELKAEEGMPNEGDAGSSDPASEVAEVAQPAADEPHRTRFGNVSYGLGVPYQPKETDYEPGHTDAMPPIKGPDDDAAAQEAGAAPEAPAADVPAVETPAEDDAVGDYGDAAESGFTEHENPDTFEPVPNIPVWPQEHDWPSEGPWDGAAESEPIDESAVPALADEGVENVDGVADTIVLDDAASLGASGSEPSLDFGDGGLDQTASAAGEEGSND